MLHIGITAATLWIRSMSDLRVALARLCVRHRISDVKQRDRAPKRRYTQLSVQ